MSTTLALELEHNKKRLQYYTELKEKQISPKVMNKWIEVYSERVAKIERQLKKLQAQQEGPGLKVQIQKSSSASRAQRA